MSVLTSARIACSSVQAPWWRLKNHDFEVTVADSKSSFMHCRTKLPQSKSPGFYGERLQECAIRGGLEAWVSRASDRTIGVGGYTVLRAIDEARVANEKPSVDDVRRSGDGIELFKGLRGEAPRSQHVRKRRDERGNSKLCRCIYQKSLVPLRFKVRARYFVGTTDPDEIVRTRGRQSYTPKQLMPYFFPSTRCAAARVNAQHAIRSRDSRLVGAVQKGTGCRLTA